MIDVATAVLIIVEAGLCWLGVRYIRRDIYDTLVRGGQDLD